MGEKKPKRENKKKMEPDGDKFCAQEKKATLLLHFGMRRDLCTYISSIEEKFILLYAFLNCLLVSFPSTVLI